MSRKKNDLCMARMEMLLNLEDSAVYFTFILGHCANAN